MMKFIEKIKGFFKPKLTFEQFAVAITSDVRIAIIEELGSIYVAKGFQYIKKGVSDRLDRPVSEKSLTWHLEKLKNNKIIEEILGYEYTLWKLMSRGREVYTLLEKVERELEAEE